MRCAKHVLLGILIVTVGGAAAIAALVGLLILCDQLAAFFDFGRMGAALFYLGFCGISLGSFLGVMVCRESQP